MDVLDITVSVVVALGVILAFVVQRARYLREIEPDLEVTWNNEVFLITEEDTLETLKQEWGIATEVHIENRSNRNHADNLELKVDLGIYPRRSSSPAIVATYPHPYHIRPSALLAGRSADHPIFFNAFSEPGLQETMRSYAEGFRVEDAGFWARITVEYCTKFEGLLFVLSPWKLSYSQLFLWRWRFEREKYTRSIAQFWGYTYDEPLKPPYSYRKWNFPLSSLARKEGPRLS